MKVALYLRVSTDKQETEDQAAQLREFVAKQGWQIIHEYCDYESGSKNDRADFQAMFQDASRRKFDLLLFWALDRLSREGVLPTLQHLNALTSYGVAWRSYRTVLRQLRAVQGRCYRHHGHAGQAGARQAFRTYEGRLGARPGRWKTIGTA